MSTAEVVDDDAVGGEAAEYIKDKQVTDIVRSHALYSSVGGLVPIPLIDIGAALTIQLRMIAKLCDVYGVEFSRESVKVAISALVVSALPRGTIGYPTISLVKGVPVVGTLLGVLTLPVYNAVFTWALGRVFAWHFARGGSLKDIDTAEMSERMGEELKAGKDEVAAAAGRAKK